MRSTLAAFGLSLVGHGVGFGLLTFLPAPSPADLLPREPAGAWLDVSLMTDYTSDAGRPEPQAEPRRERPRRRVRPLTLEPPSRGDAGGGIPSDVASTAMAGSEAAGSAAGECISLPSTVLARQREFAVEPRWPPAARAAGLSGSVTLRVCTDDSGAVRDVEVVDSNPVFDAASVEAVRQWRYRPYVKDGRPTSICGPVTLDFELR